MHGADNESSRVTAYWRTGLAGFDVAGAALAPRLTGHRRLRKRTSAGVAAAHSLVHFDLSLRRAKPYRYVRHEAERARRRSAASSARLRRRTRDSSLRASASTARVMDRLAIVRSMHHPMTNHNAAAFTALCGRDPLKGDLELLGNDRNDPPCYGAIMSATDARAAGVADIRRVATRDVQRRAASRASRRFSGSAHGPFQVSADPSAPDFRMGELELPGELTLDRLDNRAKLLGTLDDPHGHVSQTRDTAGNAGSGPGLDPRDVYTEKALRLLHSPAVRQAFDLGSEGPRLRDRYGRNKLGQSVLLARRLVEAGVRFVTVYDGQYNGQTANWDAHQNVFGRLKHDLVPPADQSFSALIDDLSGRGLLDETLVIAMGEFGRTPKINTNAGRDHWPNCYSIILAGGGVRGGVTFGSSDKMGAYPDSDAVSPADLAATLFWRFGLDPVREMADLTGRPYKLADGQPIKGLFG